MLSVYRRPRPCAVPGHSDMGAKHFGARVARLEDPTLLTGRARFVDDIDLPGTLHACFVRSPHAHARIRSIDASAARAWRSEEHTSELQSRPHLVCRLLLEKKKRTLNSTTWQTRDAF